jgi:hypothetical protein
MVIVVLHKVVVFSFSLGLPALSPLSAPSSRSQHLGLFIVLA